MRDGFAWAIGAVKAAAIAVILLLVSWKPVSIRYDGFLIMGRYREAAVFVALIAFCVLSLLIVPFLKSWWTRVPLVALAVLGFASDYVFQAISGQRLNPTHLAMLWREQAMIEDAVAGYFWAGLRATGWILPLALVLAWKPARPAALRSLWAIVPVATFAGCVAVTKITIHNTNEFPSPFGVPAMAAIAVTSTQYSGPREEVRYSSAPRPAFRNIVMIVDESIRGDYLEINNASEKTTPYLAGLGGELVNFGPAVAAHNCSAAARLILRTGLTPASLPDLSQRSLKGPAIWQFAQKAGYRTHYVDAFVSVFGTHSYMTKAEHESIDVPVPVGLNPVYDRDHHIAKEVLPKVLAGDRPAFIYVNKYGAHFPYRNGYPRDFGDGAQYSGDELNDRDKLVASYRLAVKWSVDEFFRALLPGIDLRETLILYTSDHGQSLLEGGYKLTHCSTGNKVHPGEGIVPLFALSGQPDFNARLSQAAKADFGTATHFEVFPTLLLAMGYDEAWVVKHYGQSLLHLSGKAERKFLTGDMFGIHLDAELINRGARWIKVD